MLFYCEYAPSPVGKITIVSDGNAVIGLGIEGQKHFLYKVPRPLVKNEDLPLFSLGRNWLDAYFAGKNPGLEGIPLKPQGSFFQQKVWQALLAIPFGKTVTYGDIAKAVDCKSPQAVGGAVGKNPISILIPCHRVIGKDGNLTGYDGGIDKKRILLELESIVKTSG